jgi:hypothetical protein
MEALCGIDADETEIESRVLRFLSDRDCDMVTGIRRMGREKFVSYVSEIAKEKGIHITVLSHWDGLENEVSKILSEDPGADIAYGQDLCHQVPAVVRYRKRD